ncbi:ATP-binding cassette domain-containing protein [Streptosporangium sp. NPDC051022]|uniref:ABC transporter ATP-binding protein n=1 Tax=Streptosporangium sp. NPDC051022 TaxID=3155752 RepID=UPI00341440ED
MGLSPAQPAISAIGLRKSFGDRTVLDGLDLHVPAGTIFSLLGPNGSGKTTTARILSTLTCADAGRVRIAGHDLAVGPGAARAVIGAAGLFSRVDVLRTGEENLTLTAALHRLNPGEGRRRVAELLDRFDLAEAAGSPVATYSGGMRRRLDLAMILVGDPRVIFLDEPTSGMDARGRRAMWRIIRGLVAENVTVFHTTRCAEEAEELADRIAVLDHGRLVAEGTVEELKRLAPDGHVLLRFTGAEEFEWATRAFAEAPRDDDAFTLRIPSDCSVGSLRVLFNRIDHELLAVDELSVHTPGLDDVLLTLTNHPTNRKTPTL